MEFKYLCYIYGYEGLVYVKWLYYILIIKFLCKNVKFEKDKLGNWLILILLIDCFLVVNLEEFGYF